MQRLDLGLACLLLPLLGSSARAQCPSWLPQFTSATAPDGRITASIVFDADGPGPLPPALYVGGRFQHIGGMAANHVARWDGSTWSTVGSLPQATLAGIDRFAIFDEDGPGPQPAKLFASGFPISPTSSLMRLDANTWTAIPIATSALATFDPDGAGPAPERLIAFDRPHLTISSWDGVSVTALAVTNAAVLDLVSFDPDGPGPQQARLYAAGLFTILVSPTVNFPVGRIAAFDGSTWSGVAGGLDGNTNALGVYHPSGPAGPGQLFVAGAFAHAGGVATDNLAVWDGSNWSGFGTRWAAPVGFEPSVLALQSFDLDGPGPAPEEMYVAGDIPWFDAALAANIERWDGGNWSTPGGGIDGPHTGSLVYALTPFDPDGPGPQPPALFVGGKFGGASGVPSNDLVRWTDHGCNVELCAGDGTLPTNCPCGNVGLGGHGCANSVDPAGGRLQGSGMSALDQLSLGASGLPDGAACVFVQSSGFAPNGAVLGAGLTCLAGQLRRIGVKTTFFGTAGYPETGDPSIGARSAALGDPLAFNDVRYYQAIYRDGNPSFCPSGSSFNTTNLLRVAW